MNKTMTLRGYYGLVLVFIWDTFNYNIPDRLDTCYDFWLYLRGHNYAYTFCRAHYNVALPDARKVPH